MLRTSFFRGLWLVTAASALGSLAGVSACGRSDLDDYLVADGGKLAETGTDAPNLQDVQPIEAAGCNASTCPDGCCDTTGACKSGSLLAECGILGEECRNCQAEGFQLCDPTRHACGNTVAECGPSTCAGCCEGDECFAGTDPNECGTSGEACQHCAASGLACNSQQCTQPGCGPQNCAGCCFGDQCVGGTDQTACGVGGQVCVNCAASGSQCQPEGPGGACSAPPPCNPSNCQGCCVGDACTAGTAPTACGIGGQTCTDCSSLGGTCVPEGPGTGGVCTTQPPPVCNAQTCPDGCCDGANCLPGNLNTYCGTGGAACTNCGASGESCTNQTCGGQPPSCNSANCAGCCDQTNTCQAGFIDTQCGQGGVSCEDCTVLVPASTCDVSVSPRTCESQQVLCPAPYPSCPSNLETPSPTQQDVCSATDLENAGEACEGGAHSAACQEFFSFEQSSNPACAQCLTPFDYDFSELTGLTTCVAPFADAACNHITACLVACTDASCANCTGAGALQNCQDEVPTSVCATYYDGAQCIDGAFFGAGSFCNPNQGTGLFGDWLEQVGEYYCGGQNVVDAGFGE